MPKVLIVDDLDSNRYVLKVLFKLFGPEANIELFESSSGVGSVEMVRSHEPDLILMDVKMEREESGIEAVKAIRSIPQLRSIPIWAVTAQAMDAHDGQESDRERCLKAGFSDYFTKPVSQKDMMVRISKVLNVPIPDKVRQKMGLSDEQD